MLKLVKACAPWLDWKVAGMAVLVAVGVAVCLGAPALGFLAGAAPLLLIVACLVPCLVPRHLRSHPAERSAGAGLGYLRLRPGFLQRRR
jgi:hypothetical protein